MKADPAIDTVAARALVQFLDSTLTSPDQQSQAMIIDEFCEEYIEVLSCLLTVVKQCSLHSEDAGVTSDIVFKSLGVLELFLSCKGTKESIKDSLKYENQCVR